MTSVTNYLLTNQHYVCEIVVHVNKWKTCVRGNHQRQSLQSVVNKKIGPSQQRLKQMKGHLITLETDFALIEVAKL